jgi:hypothetical protein
MHKEKIQNIYALHESLLQTTPNLAIGIGALASSLALAVYIHKGVRMDTISKTADLGLEL